MGSPSIEVYFYSLPDFAQVPFTVESLEKDLNSHAKQFFVTTSKLIVGAGEKVHLPQVLQFYKGEFITQAGSLITSSKPYIEEGSWRVTRLPLLPMAGPSISPTGNYLDFRNSV